MILYCIILLCTSCSDNLITNACRSKECEGIEPLLILICLNICRSSSKPVRLVTTWQMAMEMPRKVTETRKGFVSPTIPLKSSVRRLLAKENTSCSKIMIIITRDIWTTMSTKPTLAKLVASLGTIQPCLLHLRILVIKCDPTALMSSVHIKDTNTMLTMKTFICPESSEVSSHLVPSINSLNRFRCRNIIPLHRCKNLTWTPSAMWMLTAVELLHTICKLVDLPQELRRGGLISHLLLRHLDSIPKVQHDNCGLAHLNGTVCHLHRLLRIMSCLNYSRCQTYWPILHHNSLQCNSSWISWTVTISPSRALLHMIEAPMILIFHLLLLSQPTTAYSMLESHQSIFLPHLPLLLNQWHHQLHTLQMVWPPTLLLSLHQQVLSHRHHLHLLHLQEESQTVLKTEMFIIRWVQRTQTLESIHILMFFQANNIKSGSPLKNQSSPEKNSILSPPGLKKPAPKNMPVQDGIRSDLLKAIRDGKERRSQCRIYVSLCTSNLNHSFF